MRHYRKAGSIILSFLLLFVFTFHAETLVSATSEPNLKSGIGQEYSGEGSITITPIPSSGTYQSISGTSEDEDGLQTGTSNQVSGESIVEISDTSKASNERLTLEDEELQLETGTTNEVSGKASVTTKSEITGEISKRVYGAVIYESIDYEAKKKKWVHSFRVVSTIGKPSKVTYKSKILTKSEKKGKETTYKTTSKTFIGKQLKPGYTYKKYYKPKTSYLRLKGTLKVYTGPLLVVNTTNANKVRILNKKVQHFPNYYDKYADKNASSIKTNWKEPEKKIPRRSTDTVRKEYKKAYNVTIKWKADKIDLHHIRPVKYGGNSKLSNYMALPNEKHKLITKWFANY